MFPRRMAVVIAVPLALVAVLLRYSEAPGGAPDARQEITVAVSWLRPFDPLRGFHVGAFGVIERLVRFGPSGLPEPELASRWERLDPTTWRFHLRAGILFHDGTPVTAASVKLSLERWLNSRTAWAIKPPIKTISTEGSHIIVITTEWPTDLLPNYLAPCPIASPTSVDADGRFIKPIGTGPFVFESGRERIEMVLVRNERYWNGAPTLRRMTIREVKDPQARVLMLEAGEVDAITEVLPQAVAPLQANPRIQVVLSGARFTHQLVLNLDRAPFDDLRARRAIAFALDRDAIAKHVLEGIGTVAKGPFPPSFPGVAPDLRGYPSDPAKAAALLAAAGWSRRNASGILEKDGRPLRVSLLTHSYRAELPPMVEAIQGQLRRLGIDAEVQVLEWGALEDAMRKGKYQLVLTARAVGFLGDPLGYFMVDIHSRAPYNLSRFRNARVDRLLEKAVTTLNRQERFELYREVQHIIEDAVPIVYVTHDVQSAAVNARVRGFAFASPFESRYTVEKVSVIQP